MHYKDSHEFILYARFLDEECQHRVKKRQKKHFHFLFLVHLSLSLFISLSLSLLRPFFNLAFFSLSFYVHFYVASSPYSLSLSLTLSLSDERSLAFKCSQGQQNQSRTPLQV